MFSTCQELRGYVEANGSEAPRTPTPKPPCKKVKKEKATQLKYCRVIGTVCVLSCFVPDRVLFALLDVVCIVHNIY